MCVSVRACMVFERACVSVCQCMYVSVYVFECVLVRVHECVYKF